MKRFLSIVFLVFICVSNFVHAQKIFDCDVLSFTYPSSFNIATINNAPNMLLKLESNEYFFSISSWDYNVDESIDIWDDRIYERYKNFCPDGAKLVSIDKIIVDTKSGKKHSLRLKTNAQKNNFKLKTVFYLMLNKGRLFTFTFMSEGVYSKQSSTDYTDNLLKGLYFKCKNQQIDTTIIKNKTVKTYIDFCKTINRQTPIYVDEYTTLNSMTFVNYQLIATYKVNIDFSSVSNEDRNEILGEVKDSMKVTIKSMFMRSSDQFNQKSLINEMKSLGLKFKANYYDINNQFIGSIIYDYTDFSS